jgi:sugar (pentulose or hexulose) kinase
MEAIAFNLRQNLESVGIDTIKELRITGGGASSPLWAGIKANVVKKELSTLKEGETACLGSALAAAVGYFSLVVLLKALKGRWFWLFGPYCLAAGLLTLILV